MPGNRVLIVAQLNHDGGLTENVEEMPAPEADALCQRGTHISFGTWEAYRKELIAQKKETGV